MTIKLLSRVGLLVCGLFLSSCRFSALGDDVRALDAAATISGTVSTSFETEKPIFIALFRRVEGRGLKLDGYALRYGPGDFTITREQGAFLIGAFEDVNKDLKLQTNEYVGWYGSPIPTTIRVDPGTDYGGIDIALLAPEQARKVLPGIYAPGVPQLKMQQAEYPLGELVSLEDARFNTEAGQTGLWEPVKFYTSGYAGIFFLEPYDPERIPVLFVHGIGGHAAEWRYLVDQLDTEKYQPWLVQYPSGIRLGMISDGLTQGVLELQTRHAFTDLVVVAHSMGGLVARGFINRNQTQGSPELVKLFATLSTPWQGHAAAELGVDMAPVAVPSWHDMVPDSPYIRSLFAQPLPASTAYFLLFSHRGNFKLTGGGNSDGTVTLKSQLPAAAQKAAERVIGYDEDHTSILRSEDVALELRTILAQTAQQLRLAASQPPDEETDK